LVSRMGSRPCLGDPRLFVGSPLSRLPYVGSPLSRLPYVGVQPSFQGPSPPGVSSKRGALST
jgi:hypothetical protein